MSDEKPEFTFVSWPINSVGDPSVSATFYGVSPPSTPDNSSNYAPISGNSYTLTTPPHVRWFLCKKCTHSEVSVVYIEHMDELECVCERCLAKWYELPSDRKETK